MGINWKGLFTEAGIAWRDRGANWSRGNINIRCPFCADDPSQHLSIAEGKQAYFCRRDSRHKGRDLIYLLGTLDIRKAEAMRLLSRYSDGKLELIEERQTPIRELGNAATAWGRFMPAQDSIPCLAYLKNDRGFPSPALTCAAYDLRFAQAGRWTQRILMPFKNPDGDVVSWVGRSLYRERDPRYMMEDARLPALLYMPRMARRALMIFEGPFDALKVAAASEAEDIATLAILGKNLNASKLLLLAELADGADQIYWTPDDGVPLGEWSSIAREMQQALRRPVKRYALPAGVKDAGEMSFDAVQEWIAPLV